MKKWVLALLTTVFIFLFIVVLSWISANWVHTDIEKGFFVAFLLALVFFGIIWFDE